MKCASCKRKECYEGKDCTDIKETSKKEYSGRDLEMMKAASKVESGGYGKKTRLEELIFFAEGMGYKKLGLAFCIGLEEEAEIIGKILSKHFEVFSVCCKLCGIDKEEFGLARVHRERDFEAACNPRGQADILNREDTDMNIILGLCLGHDILFTKSSKAPVTTLAVKDRVLSHNPLAAVYSKYHRKKFDVK